eukprot:TRINITY_DN33195_c0_g1_i1.p1 TRINITY_DN33195_c0_g1~~TRINITY_DN33195_c0_g1_i1.p1  ORF type:complete len:177 (-),score=34.87 TRINITY_DN33195_c0_g1_i1:152-682(-)
MGCPQNGSSELFGRDTAPPLWQRDPEDITDEEYGDLYKALTRQREMPLTCKHLVIEGQLRFKAILFVPPRASCMRRKDNVKVHFNGAPDQRQLMPEWLDFVHGVIDFEGGPETLPWDERYPGVMECIVHGCIMMFEEVCSQDQLTFQRHFGKHLRESWHEKVIAFQERLNETGTCG